MIEYDMSVCGMWVVGAMVLRRTSGCDTRDDSDTPRNYLIREPRNKFDQALCLALSKMPAFANKNISPYVA